MRSRKPGVSGLTTLLLGILLGICSVLLAANLWRLSQPPRPDPRIVSLAVRATVFAIPTPTPRVIEVTRVVEVVVEVTPVPPTATATLTPTLAPPETPLPPESARDDMEVLPAADRAGDAAAAALDTGFEGAAFKAAASEEPQAELAGEEAEADPPAQPPAPAPGPCPAGSAAQYTTVPVDGGGLHHPDALHADLNLSLRGYAPTDAPPNLFDKDGPVDGDPPQLAGIFEDYRPPTFGQSYRVNDWNWSCGEHGCAAGPLDHVAATLVTLAASPGEHLGIPHRGAQVYGGGYKALVLYAEATRITLGYTREDSVANGYAVHLENICVDPNLLALYQGSNAAGRGFLPALREDETLGTTPSGAVLVAVRDRGVFFDPRSRLDWWHGF